MEQIVQMFSGWFTKNPVKNAFSLIALQKNINGCLKPKKTINYDNINDLISKLDGFDGWIIGRPVARESINYFLNSCKALDIMRCLTNLLISSLQSKGMFYHFGILDGDNVIEFGTDEMDKTTARVRKIPLRDFIASIENTNNKIRLIQRTELLEEHNIMQVKDTNTIRQRYQEEMDSYLGIGNAPKPYDAAANNCDHVAHYISCGSRKSIQSDIIMRFILGPETDKLIEDYQKNYYVIDFPPQTKEKQINGKKSKIYG